MPKITNKRYLKHFRKGKIDVMSPQEFYENWRKIRAPAHLERLLKEYFLLLYWTGRRPVEILELKGSDFRILKRVEKDGKYYEYLAIDTHTKKGGKPVEVFLVFDQIPRLREAWARIETVPADFQYFALLESNRKKRLVYSTKAHEIREKQYTEKTHKIWYWCNKFFGVPPYFLRHNRFSTMVLQGAKFEDIKTFKGAKSMASVEPYISPDEETLRGLGRKIK